MISVEKDRASGSSGGRNSTAQSQSFSSSQSGSKLSLSFAPIVLVSDSGNSASKLAVQRRYNLNLFLSVLTGSLQGFAERPLPCSYNVIPSSSPFHGADAGSNPAGDAKSITYRRNIYSLFNMSMETMSDPASQLKAAVLPT